ncbi:MAG: hypothetical protein AABM40_13795 [Chloroflexota bacterium]
MRAFVVAEAERIGVTRAARNIGVSRNTVYRRRRRSGPLCGLSRRTAYRILRRYRMHRLRELFPPERIVRGTFQASVPGEVLPIDIKSLGRLTRGGGRMGRAAEGN